MTYDMNVGLCLAQDPDTPEEYSDGFRVFKINDFRTLEDMRQDVYRQFDRKEADYGLKLHPESDCRYLLSIHDMKVGGDFEPPADPRHEPFVRAHFIKRPARSLFLSPEASMPATAARSVSARSKKRPASTAARPASSVKKPAKAPLVAVHGSVDERDEHDEHQYVRVGARADTSQEAGEERDMEVLLVAEVNVAKGKISYLAVDTWVINGIRIGDCETGDQAKGVESADTWIHDEYFEDALSKKSLKPKILELFQDGDPGFAAERIGQPRQGAIARRSRSEPLRPIELPIKPTTIGLLFPAGLDEFHPASEAHVNGGVNLIFCFVNRVDDEVNLGFDVNLQAAFEPNSTLDQVRDYIINGEEGFDGIAGKLEVYYGWEMELWVLPQAPACTEMYSWDNVAERVISAFLDESMSADTWFGKHLYVEVHIVPKKGFEEERGGETKKKRRGMTKKTGKKSSVESGSVKQDEEEYGRQKQRRGVARKGSPKPRATSSSSDDDYDGGEMLL